LKIGASRIGVLTTGILKSGILEIDALNIGAFETTVLRIGRLKNRVDGHYVFKVYAYGSGVDDLSDGSFKGCNVSGEAGLYIGSDGHFDGAADASDSLKHLRPGKILSVREAESVGHGGAASGDGGQAAMLNHGGAGCVPGVDEDERLRGVMQLKQARSFLCGRVGVRGHNERMIAEWREDQNLTTDNTDETDFH
jgi:hypothetical protein